MNRSPFASMPATVRADLLRIMAAAAPSEDPDTNSGRELVAELLRNDEFGHAVAVEVERNAG